MELFRMTDIIPLLGIQDPPASRGSYNIPCICCDEKPRDRHMNINIRKDEPGQAPEIRKLISELKPGDQVRMTVHHNYIKDESAHYPARPVVQMERIPAASDGSDVKHVQQP